MWIANDSAVTRMRQPESDSKIGTARALNPPHLNWNWTIVRDYLCFRQRCYYYFIDGLIDLIFFCVSLCFRHGRRSRRHRFNLPTCWWLQTYFLFIFSAGFFLLFFDLESSSDIHHSQIVNRRFWFCRLCRGNEMDIFGDDWFWIWWSLAMPPVIAIPFWWTARWPPRFASVCNIVNRKCLICLFVKCDLIALLGPSDWVCVSRRLCLCDIPIDRRWTNELT